MIYLFEYTDTFGGGGDVNYSWVYRFKVTAPSMRSALRKVSKELGGQGRLKPVYEGRWDIRGSCTCVLGEEWDDSYKDYGSLKELT
jgi:hypothetical protein